MPEKKLLLLDNAMHPDLYRPADHWLRFAPGGFRAVIVRWHDPPPNPAGFSHVIISGSEASITSPDPWVEGQLNLVRTAVRRRIPLLGSCHGHQMIALALGGPSCVRKSPTPEFGWVPVEILERDGLFSGAASPAFSFTSHFDEVASLWPGAVAIARTPGCGIAAVRIESAPVFGIQPHPEVSPDEGARLLDEFSAVFPEMKRHARSLPPRDSGLAAAITANFFRL